MFMGDAYSSKKSCDRSNKQNEVVEPADMLIKIRTKDLG